MVKRHEIIWKLAPNVVDFLSPYRQQLGEEKYNKNKNEFKEFMCGYFNAVPGCAAEQGVSISPIAAPPVSGWKALKVRWALPDSTGKSGDLRLLITLNCAQKSVNVRGIWWRKENPQNSDFMEASKNPDI